MCASPHWVYTERVITKPKRKPTPRVKGERREVVSVRTHPDVRAKIYRNGPVWLERIVREAKEADEVAA